MSLKQNSRFEKIDLLGSGSFGDVFSVRDTLSEDIFAMKSMVLTENSKSLSREMEVLYSGKFSSPFLLKYHYFFSDGSKCHILMEYCENNNLEMWLGKQNGFLSEQEIKVIFVQIIEGLSVLHKNGIIHRDIKPQNILLNRFLEVKLADFGLAKEVSGTDGGNTATGTWGFIPAEVLDGKKFSPASDVFALGCTLYFLATKRLPFGEGYVFLLNVIRGVIPPIIEGMYSIDLKNLVYNMLDKDPDKRPTLEDLKTHPILRSAFENMNKRRPVPVPLPLGMQGTGERAGAGSGTLAGSGSKAGTGVVAVTMAGSIAETESEAVARSVAGTETKITTKTKAKAKAEAGAQLRTQLNIGPNSISAATPIAGTEAQSRTQLNNGSNSISADAPIAGIVLPIGFRRNQVDGFVPTIFSNRYTFAPPDGKYRNVFLDKPVAGGKGGVFRWTVKVSEINPLFYIGIAPADLVGRFDLDNTALGWEPGSCSLKPIGVPGSPYMERIVGGANHNGSGSQIYGVVNDTRAPRAVAVCGDSLIAAEVDTGARTLAFFVDEEKDPRVIAEIHLPAYFGLSGFMISCFVSVSFRRLSVPTPSTVACTLYSCKAKPQK